MCSSIFDFRFLVNDVNNDPGLLKRVIAGDETRLQVYGYDVETKAQLSQWMLPDEPRPKNARKGLPTVKVLFAVFFDYNGVHHEFLPKGNTKRKLCNVCVKQYGSNDRNCEKINRGFCITIMHHLTYQYLFVIFCSKTKP